MQAWHVNDQLKKRNIEFRFFYDAMAIWYYEIDLIPLEQFISTNDML